MSDSVSTKSTVILNAIAITVALAVVAGYMPLKFEPPTQLQSLFNQTSVTKH